MDTVIDFISVFIIDPIQDFLRGKFKIQAWAKHTGIGILLGLATLVCIFAAAYFWYLDIYVLSVVFGAGVVALLAVDAVRFSRWRKETGREE